MPGKGKGGRGRGGGVVTRAEHGLSDRCVSVEHEAVSRCVQPCDQRVHSLHYLASDSYFIYRQVDHEYDNDKREKKFQK